MTKLESEPKGKKSYCSYYFIWSITYTSQKKQNAQHKNVFIPDRNFYTMGTF